MSTKPIAAAILGPLLVLCLAWLVRTMIAKGGWGIPLTAVLLLTGILGVLHLTT